MSQRTPSLAKAALIDLGSLERLVVRWNPRSYRLEQSWTQGWAGGFASSSLPSGGGPPGEPPPAAERPVREVFSTRLLLDSTEEEGGARDLRAWTERLDRWSSSTSSAASSRGEVLFAWGPFSFQGRLLERAEEWVLFDPDGTPVRAWVDIVLGR